MVQKTQALEAYQEAGEEPGALECIPMLKRSDIKKEAGTLKNEELSVDDSLFLYHDVCTNGIGYVDMMFKTDSIAPEQIPYLGLLKSVLGYVDTQAHTYGELFNEINASTGGISCGVEVFDRADSTEEFQALFSIRGKALYPKLGFLFKMAEEILDGKLKKGVNVEVGCEEGKLTFTVKKKAAARKKKAQAADTASKPEAKA